MSAIVRLDRLVTLYQATEFFFHLIRDLLSRTRLHQKVYEIKRTPAFYYRCYLIRPDYF